MPRSFIKIDGKVVDHEGAQAGVDLSIEAVEGFMKTNYHSPDARQICTMIANSLRKAKIEMHNLKTVRKS